MENYRMYVLVLRQLNGINKGIQAAHACMEYAEAYKDTKEWKQYVTTDKTMIVLNGGVSSDLIDIKTKLETIGYPFTVFCEPDLNNCMTAIAFILKDRVFDKKTFPPFEQYFAEECFVKNNAIFKEDVEKAKEEWIKTIMNGERNVILRDIIGGLHFA